MDHMNDIKVSDRYKNQTKALVNAMIESYENAGKPAKETHTDIIAEEAITSIKGGISKDQILQRYHSFAETVRNSLVTEALYKIYTESIDPAALKDNTNKTIMRSIVSQYVHETGYNNILEQMETASVEMSMLYNSIMEAASDMLSNVDKNDPDTFKITSSMRDDFYNALNYSDTQAISDAINQRVSDGISDFITANTKDHDSIEAALKKAQDELGKVPEKDEELKEAYEMRARRTIGKIRNSDKGVFHSMVAAVCESAMKKPNDYKDFFNEGKLDIEKVVDRTALMYTFIEMLNTTRLEKIDAAYLENMISNMKE